MNSTGKPITKRKLINKIRKKNKRRVERLASSYEKINQEGGGLKRIMNQNQAEDQFQMVNQITMGQNRKMKKKLKKLKKRISGEDAPDKIFKEMQKYKSTIIRTQEKTIFNPVNQLAKRRERRMKRMEQNAKNYKKQVMHKKFQ